MKPATLVSVTATLLFGGVAAEGGLCTGSLLYCGKTLKNMGWSTTAIWTWIEGTYREPTRDDHYDNLLFRCQDNLFEPRTLWYLLSCTKGCVDAGAGKSDYCR